MADPFVLDQTATLALCAMRLMLLDVALIENQEHKLDALTSSTKVQLSDLQGLIAALNKESSKALRLLINFHGFRVPSCRRLLLYGHQISKFPYA